MTPRQHLQEASHAHHLSKKDHQREILLKGNPLSTALAEQKARRVMGDASHEYMDSLQGERPTISTSSSLESAQKESLQAQRVHQKTLESHLSSKEMKETAQRRAQHLSLSLALERSKTLTPSSQSPSFSREYGEEMEKHTPLLKDLGQEERDQRDLLGRTGENRDQSLRHHTTLLSRSSYHSSPPTIHQQVRPSSGGLLAHLSVEYFQREQESDSLLQRERTISHLLSLLERSPFFSPEEGPKEKRQKILSFLNIWELGAKTQHPSTLLLQKAAAQEFSLSFSLTLFSKEGERHPALLPAFHLLDQQEGGFYRQMLSLVLSLTKADLLSYNLKEGLVLYKGLSWKKAPEWALEASQKGYGHLLQQECLPLSSWTVMKHVAQEKSSQEDYGLLLEGTFPLESLASTGKTGYGSLDQGEVIVLSTPGVVKVSSWDHREGKEVLT